MSREIRLTGNLSFGNVPVGETVVRTLTVHNDGNSPLDVYGIDYPHTVFRGDLDRTIGAGSSRDVDVYFTPTATQPYSGNLLVRSNATSGTNTRSISGTGVTATRIIRLTGDMSFGDVPVGATAQRTLTINNDGNATLNVTNINYSSASFSGSWSGSIRAGRSRDVTITFAPTEAREYSCVLTVHSDKTSGDNTQNLSGRGITRIIQLDCDLDYGTVEAGASKAGTLTIHNTGNVPLTVTGISYSSPAFTGPWNGEIEAGHSQNVPVTFAPPTPGTYTATVTVNSNATSGDNTCSATGYAPSRIIRLECALQFGNVQIDESGQLSFTICNDGDAPLIIDGIQYSSTVLSGNWSGSVAPDACSAPITVTFSPAEVTQYSEELTVISNATSGIANCLVQGAGIVPARIILNGAEEMTLECGLDNYEELGAEAWDIDETPLAVTIEGTVDTGAIGEYVITYSATPSVGEPVTATRTVTVADTTPPEITICGEAQTVSTVVRCQGRVPDFTSAVIAADSCSATNDLVVEQTPASGTLVGIGAHSVLISVKDESDNIASCVVTLTVEDTTPPVITRCAEDMTVATDNDCRALVPDFTGTVVAVDNCSASDALLVTQSPEAGEAFGPGAYPVTVSVVDTAGNTASCDVLLTVVDRTTPQLTLVGDVETVIECRDAYIDAGATALDACDGDLTASIVLGGDSIDTTIPGAYLITYNVSDFSGNSADELTRIVRVVDTTAPVITLLGEGEVRIECGDAYNDAGATASDVCDGDVTDEIDVEGAVDTGIAGIYSIRYTVRDSAGNAAVAATRTVMVEDTTPPQISLLGDAVVEVECRATYSEADATAWDSCDGDLSGAVRVGGDKVDTRTPGIYSVTYNVSDSSGNAADEVTRTVNVVDTMPPEITLLGMPEIVVVVGGVYTEYGAVAWDVCEGNMSVDIGGDVVDPMTPGVYVVAYSAIDSGGNVAALTRTVYVVDAGQPYLAAVYVLDSHTIRVVFNKNMSEDAFDPLNYLVSGTGRGTLATNPDNVIGADAAYDLIWNCPDIMYRGGDIIIEVAASVEDAEGNPMTVARIRTRPGGGKATLPEIAVNGDLLVTVACGDVYADAGAVATDQCDTDLTAEIMTVNPVDSGTIGVYTVSYAVNDAAGNAAFEATRTVQVEDTAAPTITLLGDTVVTLAYGETYTDAGATAWDACDGDLTDAIMVGGDAVNPNRIGTYIVRYQLVDSSGNAAAEVSRTVHVVDTIQPYLTAITVIDAQRVQVIFSKEMGVDALVPANYTVYGTGRGTLSDHPETVDGTGDTYLLMWGCPAIMHHGGDITVIVKASVRDAAGNPMIAPIARTHAHGAIADPPVITLSGNTSITLECGDTYIEAGATATDGCGADVSALIAVSGDAVDSSVVGTYLIYYDVSDSAGNTAMRAVRTIDVVDVQPPVITLTGSPEVVVELGGSYVDAGATAYDACDGNLTDYVVVSDDSVDTNTLGTYNIIYNVSDNESNAAQTVTRTVYVSDPATPYLAGVTVVDAHSIEVVFSKNMGADALVPANYTLVGTGRGTFSTRPTSVVGSENTYLLSWSCPALMRHGGDVTIVINAFVEDDAGNTMSSPLSRTHYGGAIAPLPIITLSGEETVIISCGGAYTDAGATAIGGCDSDLSAFIEADGDTVDTNTTGDYVITYNVSDSADNAAAEVTRTVTVVDTVSPNILLLGDALVEVPCGETYTDAGASAWDGCDGDLTGAITVGGDIVDASVSGAYVITYNVSDNAANAADEIVRTVNVVDSAPPTINIIGEPFVTIACGDNYEDAGATAYDACDGDLTAQIVVGGDVVDPNIPGTYSITYNVSDDAANAAEELMRTITVVDEEPPVITLIGDSAVMVECGDNYEDAGATAYDICDGEVTATLIVSGDDVDTNVPGTYVFNYNVTDSAGNIAVEVTRIVTVIDTTPPVITLLGDAEVLVSIGEDYIDAGATTTDVCAGVLNDEIVVSGDTVDVNTIGTYIVRYNVSDTLGNAASEVIRMVYVVDPDTPYLSGVAVLDAHRVKVVFSKNMAASALERQNYMVSGAGRGTFDIHPDSVTGSGDTYILIWNCPGIMRKGSDIAITVAAFMEDEDGTPVTIPLTRTHKGGAAALLPEVTLLGEPSVTVACGEDYMDAGAIALDQCGIDITASIVVDNSIDTYMVGSYEVSYGVTDAAGNTSNTIRRSVTITDTTPPIIELIGDAVIALECGFTYTEPGAIASDACSGVLSGDIMIGGDTVDGNTLGTYVITYNASDAQGNAAEEVVRTITVLDTLPPVVTLLGDYEIVSGLGEEYVDAGAMAIDACEGDLTNEIIVGGDVVDTNATGTYVITYTVNDGEGNVAGEITRIVYVIDTSLTYLARVRVLNAHNIEVVFNTNMGMSALNPANYTVSGTGRGALAAQPENVVGAYDSYVLKWNCPDSMRHGGDIAISVDSSVDDEGGNPINVPLTRTHVGGAVASAPVIMLLGDVYVTVECGEDYYDEGVNATDQCGEDITLSVLTDNGTEPSLTGVYTITYAVADAAANLAEKVVRTVDVVDTYSPAITVLGSSIIEIECGDVYIEPGVIANDSCDGDLTDVIALNGNVVDTGTPGSYLIEYDVSDSAGNAAITQTRTVEVVDTIAPILSMPANNQILIELGGTLPDIEAWDICEGDVSARVMASGDVVDTNVEGAYIVTYNVADNAGNTALEEILVIWVVDPEKPYVKTIEVLNAISILVTFSKAMGESVLEPSNYWLSGSGRGTLGTHPDNVALYEEQTHTYLLAWECPSHMSGAGDITISANASIKDMEGKLLGQPRTHTLFSGAVPYAPEIILPVEIPFIVECGDIYDDGVRAYDICDGDITDIMDVDNPVDPAVTGEYIVTYTVTNEAGFMTTAVLPVEVVDTSGPEVILVNGNHIILECGVDEYEEPGYVAVDACEGDFTESVVVSGTPADASMPGVYEFTYSVSDSIGNNTEVIRFVEVHDTTPPEIMLIGNDEAIVECGSAYVDAGASAYDICGGDLTSEISVDDPVDADVPGDYVVTYSVSDTSGNEAAKTRVVRVVDSTPPQLNLGNSDAFYDMQGVYILLARGTSFGEPNDFEAVDICSGDLGDVQSELEEGVAGVLAWAWALDEVTGMPVWLSEGDKLIPAAYDYYAFTQEPGDYLVLYYAFDGNGNSYPILAVETGLPDIFDTNGNLEIFDAEGHLAVDFVRLVRVQDDGPRNEGEEEGEGEGESEGEGEQPEGEGEQPEGEGEPAEGEGEPPNVVQELFNNFDDLDEDGDGRLSLEESGLTREEFDTLDINGDGYLDRWELEVALSLCVIESQIVITEETVTVDCDGFDAAHQTIANAFKGISAFETCSERNLTDDIRVTDIDTPDAYDLDEIAGGAFDNTIAATREMFHNYFLFQPGAYLITYAVDDVTATQTIIIGDACRGCFGCYSNCAGCRPIPDNVMDLKQMMGDWLLVGLSFLVMMALINRRK